MRLDESPTPRPAERPYVEFAYRRTGAVRYLRTPEPAGPGPAGGRPQDGADTFFDVLARRRSRAPAGAPSEARLAAVLWWTAKVWADRPASDGTGRWQHRPAPSAGGRHPIDLVITGWPGGLGDLQLYNPVAHALAAVAPASPEAVAALVALARACVGPRTAPRAGSRDGVAVWHVAQPGRTAARYAHAESLVWRDAGALVATTALACEALGLACTPVGATGEPWLSTVLSGVGRVAGVGGCVIGTRAT